MVLVFAGSFNPTLPPHKASQTTRIEQSPTTKELLQSYCQQLYGQYENDNEVARIVELDRRTVKKYITGKD
ncbi:MAG TPA: hypothetical protein DCE42_06155 [Myxococcales bacterium]|nr:hypothetical protein [Deltaproteobacteria bacterium]MBU53376.1 hypothetical protein [Deltaproteobacteria bacterium]HAA54317.1 hypothetical protein [Myxococcales bacterium]